MNLNREHFRLGGPIWVAHAELLSSAEICMEAKNYFFVVNTALKSKIS